MAPQPPPPEVLRVTRYHGADAPADDTPPDLVIEVPHGATRTTDFTDLADGGTEGRSRNLGHPGVGRPGKSCRVPASCQ